MLKTLSACVLISFLLLPALVWADDPPSDEPTPAWQPPISLSGERLVTYTNDLQGSVVSPPREIDDFTAPSTKGDYAFSEQGGKIQLMYFGYMTCPDVCPTTLAEMLRAYRDVGEPSEQVNVVFVTIDPERDTLDRMSIYMSAFNEDFIGVRPESPEQLASMMADFGVIAERREVDSALEYLMDHSATVFLVAPDGRIVAQYPYGVPYTEMSNDLEVLMYFSSNDDTSRGQLMGEVAELDPAREYRIVIPEGTGTQIAMGEDPGIIPLEINLTLGEKDILVLENHDVQDYLVGGIWVAPFETVRKQFYEPQTFVGLCTVTVGRDLVEIIVSEP